MNARSLVISLFALLLVGASAKHSMAAEPSVRVETANPRLAGEVQLPVNKSRVIRVDRPVTDILVGNPEVADVMALSDRSVYVLGRKLGSTSLALYGENRHLISVMDLTITPDLPTLRQRLHEIMPGERIDVRAANESVVLSGPVSSGSQLKQALSIAESFAPGKVTNMMVLSGGQQVMLAVRFAEVQRTAAKELGLSTNIRWSAADSALAIASGIVPALAPFAAVRGVLTTGNWTIDAMLEALEQKGVIKTLAEPNLIAMSGETASFLAGGEFPIPVGVDDNNGNDRIHIEFKEFGVKLSFTPTVVGNEVINLVVRPEVSAIDRANGITIAGLVIPGLTVRRAYTTVDLRHGESFAIAGLIRSNFSDTVDQFPGIGNIPILGTLFRSASFQREETELVIIVTPYLARAAKPGQLRLPTDPFRPPTEAQLFLDGRVDGTPRPGEPGAPAASMPPGAGLAGTVGYVVK